MPTKLTVNSCSASLGWLFENVLATVGNTSNQNRFSYSKTFADGNGANQANRLYVTAATLSGAGSLNVDLAGVLLDFFGQVLTLTIVKVIYFEVTTDTTGGPVKLSGNFLTRTSGNAPIVMGGTTPTADLRVRNGGALLLAAPDAIGYGVTASTADILSLVNEDASNVATYKLAIVGVG